MKIKKILSFLLTYFLANFAWAGQTIIYTFEAGNVYDQCSTTSGKGGNYTTCVKHSCSKYTGAAAIPTSCFSTRYSEVIEADQYKKEKDELQGRINELENQILEYRQQMARSQVELMETMIRDPQFRSALAKQLKADGQR